MTRYLVALAETLADSELESHAGRLVDTTEFEIRRIRKAAGAGLPLVLRLLGASQLSTREDIDTIAERLLGLGL
jgi:hypothetical protein